MVKLKLFLFIILGNFLSFPLFARELVILYTGDSQAKLYPCGSCPASVGGGLSRRAEAIKKERSSDQKLLLIDSGGFFPSRIASGKSLQLDKTRLEFMFKVMSLLGYDAVGLSERELALGADYLEKKIKEFRLPLVSSNLKLKGLKSYLIKKAGGLKVGFIGLTSGAGKAKEIELLDYKTSLKKAVSFLKKKKVDLLVLLSSLSFNQTVNLIEEGDIDLVFFSKVNRNCLTPVKVKDTLLVTPYFQSKKLGKLTLKIKEAKIVEYKQEFIALPLNFPEDKKIKELLPACFEDQDCPLKKGFNRECIKPGANSQCKYTRITPLEVTVINIKDCRPCSIERPRALLSRTFKNINFRILDYRRPAARKYITRYNIKTLPAFIFSSRIEKRKNFSKFKRYFEKKDDIYLLDMQVAGIFYFLDRKPIPKRIDLFLSLFVRDSRTILQEIRKLIKNKKVDFYLHFIPEGYLRRIPVLERIEQEEFLRILAVKKLYPDKFWDYLLIRLKDIESTFWNKGLESLGIDIEKITDFATSQQAEKLLRENLALTRELNISLGPVILIENQKIFSLQEGEVSLEEFLKF